VNNRVRLGLIASPIAVALIAIGYVFGNAVAPHPVAIRATPSPVVSTFRVLVPGPTQFVTVTVTPPPPQPSATVEDGTWTVGLDIKPGKYRTVGTVSDCYWSITKDGSNGDDIVANDIVTGGRPSVTVKSGQIFTSDRCGPWQKVG
jgi:hypothetical protein